ncbi:hypothetical protein ColTof3_14727 [Colletotrichum tofieldiae]|nr:hypothetical protein ColTof3_14727 [Colletotrichum tofieldiae]
MAAARAVDAFPAVFLFVARKNRKALAKRTQTKQRKEVVELKSRDEKLRAVLRRIHAYCGL